MVILNKVHLAWAKHILPVKNNKHYNISDVCIQYKYVINRQQVLQLKLKLALTGCQLHQIKSRPQFKLHFPN